MLTDVTGFWRLIVFTSVNFTDVTLAFGHYQCAPMSPWLLEMASALPLHHLGRREAHAGAWGQLTEAMIQ